MFLRLVLKYPVLGLLIALTVEAWIAIPGEALIAVSTIRRTRTRNSLLFLLVAGVSGMVINDLALYLLSQAVRDVAVHLLGHHSIPLQLDGVMITGATFLPSVRSSAFLIYGLQGIGLTHFLHIALLSSGIWVSIYILLGRIFRIPLLELLALYERHKRLFAIAEVVLTVAGIAALAWPL